MTNDPAPRAISRAYLLLLVFTAGFTTLGVELSASRLLDPWFGNSLIVWASLIGLILLYLAAGYWLGGRVADRWPQPLVLLRLVAVGAFAVGVIPIVSRPVLRLASAGLDNFDAGLLGGSMAAILLLFAVPVTLLGIVSPFAIRLSIRDVAGSGEVAGRISALSTTGSILGSFLPVLFLIPALGTRRTFALLAFALLLVVLIGMIAQRRTLDIILVALASALVVWLGFRPAGPLKDTPGLVYERESAHNYIQVLDLGIERQLRLNEGEGIHSVYRPAGGLADGIWDFFLLAPAFNAAPYRPEQVQRVGIVGLAAGTMAHLYTEAYGPVRVEGAELDPAIIEAGREWFAMSLPNLTAHAVDGRRFLAYPQDPGDKYDVIGVDAYRPPYIPFHLTTVEFFQLARDRLTENGVVAVNVGRTSADYSLVDAMAATMQAVFPSVYIVDAPDGATEDGVSVLGNSLVVATAQPTTLEDLAANLPAFQSGILAPVAAQTAASARVAAPPPDTPVFTDDRAPVEQVVHALVFRYILGTGN
jgi:predicted membrane-bound spermidine synthase